MTTIENSESADGRRPFVEPIISDPVEVLKENPAATVLFAATGGSGIPSP